MAKKPHKKLEVWRKSVQLTLMIYRLTEKFPENEKFGLISQMRKAAVSIASNIAEGAARNTRKEFIHFLHNARGSLSELDTQMIICNELAYFGDNTLKQLDEEMEAVSKLLGGLIRALRT